MMRTNNKGFTMVELLVVLVIVGILAAVATPVFLGNTKKAKASEAVATMSLIRQALRDQFVSSGVYPSEVKAADLEKNKTAGGLDIKTGTAQYFGNGAFEVIAKDKGSAPWNNPAAVDFIIRANGALSNTCDKSTNCALKKAETTKYQLEMDNSGRIFVSYDTDDAGKAVDWQTY